MEIVRDPPPSPTRAGWGRPQKLKEQWKDIWQKWLKPAINLDGSPRIGMNGGSLSRSMLHRELRASGGEGGPHDKVKATFHTIRCIEHMGLSPVFYRPIGTQWVMGSISPPSFHFPWRKGKVGHCLTSVHPSSDVIRPPYPCLPFVPIPSNLISSMVFIRALCLLMCLKYFTCLKYLF